MDNITIHDAVDMAKKATTGVDGCGNAIKAGIESQMTNPASEHASALSSLMSSISGAGAVVSGALGDAVTKAKEYASSCESYLSEQMVAIQHKLPVMSAVDRVQKQAAAASGVTPGSAAGSSFQDAFSGIKTATSSASDMVAHVQGAIATAASGLTGAMYAGLSDVEKLAKAASLGVTDALQKAMSDASSSIASTVDSSKSGLDCAKATSDTATANGVTQLKSYAFGRFASNSQNPQAQEVMKQFGIPAPSAATHSSSDSFAAAAPAVAATTANTDTSLKPVSPKPLDTSTYNPPAASTPPAAVDAGADAKYKAVADAAYQIAMTYKTQNLIPAQNTFRAIKDARNYDQLMKSADKIKKLYVETYTPEQQAVLDDYAKQRAELAAMPEYKKLIATMYVYNNGYPFALAAQQNYQAWKADQSKKMLIVDKTVSPPADTDADIAAAVPSMQIQTVLGTDQASS